MAEASRASASRSAARTSSSSGGRGALDGGEVGEGAAGGRLACLQFARGDAHRVVGHQQRVALRAGDVRREVVHQRAAGRLEQRRAVERIRCAGCVRRGRREGDAAASAPLP